VAPAQLLQQRAGVAGDAGVPAPQGRDVEPDANGPAQLLDCPLAAVAGALSPPSVSP
jgi:hypothetical protein